MAEVENASMRRGGAEAARAGEAEISLVELTYRLLENLKLLIAFALMGALLAAGYTLKFVTPTYEATAKLYVTNPRGSILNLSDLQIGSYLASDYQEVFKTWEVHKRVIGDLNLKYTTQQLERMLTVTNPNGTRILYITARSSDPAEAMDIANEYAAVAKKYISETMATEEPNILSSARLPTQPVGPSKTRNILLGLVVGGMIAAGVVVARFIGDDRLKTADDVRNFAGMPTLALVPVLEGAGGRRGAGKKARRRARA